MYHVCHEHKMLDRTTTLTKKLYKLLLDADSAWMIRKRKITTASIFSQLTYSCFERRGFKHTLHKSGCEFTAQAFSKARQKLPHHVFSEINKSLQSTQTPRIFAVDGSKIHVHPSFLQQGVTTRTNNKVVSRPAKRPLMMLSSMFDVNTRTCYDSQITSHFNERRSAPEHFKAAKPGDTCIFDRGYFSQQLFHQADKLGLFVLFRLKCDAIKSVKRFYYSSNTIQSIMILHAGEFTQAYLYKYFIDGIKYICITNFESTPDRIKQMYSLRWRVETSFRRLKTDLNLEVAHSMTTNGFAQEIEARILFDTFSVLTSTERVCEVRQVTKRKLKSYFKALDEALRIFHVIQIVRERNMTYGSLIRILKFHSPP